jgi:monofunctional glycosyltransferase
MRVLAWLLRMVVRTLAAAFVLSMVAVVVYRFVDPPLTPLMVIRAVDAAVRGERVRMAHQSVPIEAISPALLRAVIASEDARFFSHWGIDMDAIESARAYNERHRGRRRRGASTITMQSARNIFLWPARTWLRKGLEVYFGTLMELLWGKRRTLEVYLNVVEWGRGIYGAEAAARHYFGVPASRLAMREAALLAAALPNPRRWNPAKPTAYLERRAATIAKYAPDVRLDDLTRSGAPDGRKGTRRRSG